MLRDELVSRLRRVMRDIPPPRYTYPVPDPRKVRLRDAQAEGGDQRMAGGTTQPSMRQSPGGQR